MGQFDITAPDGKKYRITGETREGAVDALKKHLAASTVPKVPAPPREPDVKKPSMVGAATSIVNDMNAGFQGVSPVALERQVPIGSLVRGPDNKPIYVDIDGSREDPGLYSPDKFVTQHDEKTGMELIYPRNAQNDAGPLESAGRVLGYSLPTAFPKAVAGAAGAGMRAATSAEDVIGVAPSLGMRGDTGAKLAGTLESNIVTRGPVVRDAKRVTGEIADAAGRTADMAGPGSSQFDAGSALQRGAHEFTEAFRAKESNLWGNVDKAIPKDTRIDVTGVSKVLQETVDLFSDAPNIGGSVGVSKLTGWLDDITQNGGQLTWQQARSLRTAIGESVGKIKGPLADQADGRLKQLYGALTDDLGQAAKANNAEGFWRRANEFTAAGRKRIDDALALVINADSPERAFSNISALTAAKGGRANIRKLAQIKKSMPPEEWGSFVGTFIRRAGQANPGSIEEGFSATKFLTEWRKIDPSARKLMFRGKGVETGLDKAIDALASVAERARVAESQINRSRSGAVVTDAATLMTIGYSPVSAGTVAALANISARALTNPKIVRGVTEAARGSVSRLQRLASGKGAEAVEAANVLRLIEQQGQVASQ